MISKEILPENFEKINTGFVWQQTNLMNRIQVTTSWILRFLKKTVMHRAWPIDEKVA